MVHQRSKGRGGTWGIRNMGKSKCNGCHFSRLDIRYSCLFRLQHNIKLCPCKECLVKITCDRLCTHREDILHKIYLCEGQRTGTASSTWGI